MRILCDPEEHLTPSAKSYDWLGSGIYFWEGSLARAWDWARSYESRGKIKKAFVLGAVIDLKHCLDMFDSGSSEQVLAAYQSLESFMHQSQTPMPENTGAAALDKPARHLDCAVMNTLHQMRKDRKLPAYDSVRGAFLEGNAIYPDAGFRSHTHIQICVRTTACIKGYFKPINAQA
ncbi:hypothetical protein QYQ99_25530 [Comamonas testosteroni]|uniref:hypothetical protein n=1 Tax=Comamonas testosteroni TaxID=285 RepID=UPI00265FD7B5|nr:hypothetical protein [Comamonas testosteroni]WKL15651.1 hypothetical protein QYQ99_25530 [Comamonas testosteroni]